MKTTFLLFFLLAFLPVLSKSLKLKEGYKEHGKASYYGKKFHGRLTANGEKFNMHALTAAHKSLPFNSLVKITDVTTGKQIMVRINDRGPFIKGRMLDLSKGAARELDILERGVVNVRLELVRLGTGEEEFEEEATERREEKKVVIKKPKPEGSVHAVKTFSIWGKPKPAKGYGIQIGSFTSEKQMLTEAKKAYSRDLKDLYIQQVVLDRKLHYRILYLAREDKELLAKALRRIRKMGYRQAFIRSHQTTK